MLEAYATLDSAASRPHRWERWSGLGIPGARTAREDATTGRVLSGGRLTFGIGAGWYEREARGLGIRGPNVASVRAAQETLRIGISSGPTTGPRQRAVTSLAEPDRRPQPLRGHTPDHDRTATASGAPAAGGPLRRRLQLPRAGADEIRAKLAACGPLRGSGARRARDRDHGARQVDLRPVTFGADVIASIEPSTAGVKTDRKQPECGTCGTWSSSAGSIPGAGALPPSCSGFGQHARCLASVGPYPRDRQIHELPAAMCHAPQDRPEPLIGRLSPA